MSLDPDRTVNVAVQALLCTEDPLPLIERAIDVIRVSGFYEVDTMETVTPRPTADFVKEGRGVIKIGDRRGGTTIAGKVGKFRKPF